MSTMRKKTITALLFLLFLMTLIGCHGQSGQKAFSIPEHLDVSKQYEITFWAKNDTNKTQTDIYKKAIADFQSLYPNITINLRLYTDYDKIYNDVITNIATDTTPNVCITYPDHIVTYLMGNSTVVPLDGLITDSRYGLDGSELLFDSPGSEEVIRQFMQECSINGQIYALPFMRSTEACYINKTYVEKLGYTLPDTLTWDFIWKVSEAAMAKDAGGNFLINGQSVMIPFIYKSTDNMMIQTLKQKDAGYASAKGKIQLFNDTTTQFLYTIAAHAKSGVFSTFKISSYPANFMDAGQCVFAIDSTAGATWMGVNAPLSDISEDARVDFETEVRMIPQYDPEHPQMISQGPSVCMFNKKDPQEVLASWLFTQYLLTNEVQIAYAQTEGYVPVTSKAQNAPEYQDYLSRCGEDNALHYDIKIKASRLLLEHVADTFVTPVFNGSASLRSASGQLVEDVVKASRRTQEVNAAFITDLYTDVSSLFHLDESGPAAAGKTDLGPLPSTAAVLLSCLAGTWILILVYLFWQVMYRGKRKKKQKS